MAPPPIHRPRTLVAVLIAGEVGLGLVAVGVTGPAGWTLIAPGFVAVVASLVIAAWLQAPQIRANAQRPSPRPPR